MPAAWGNTGRAGGAPSRAGEKFALFVLAASAAFYWFDFLLVLSQSWPKSVRSHYLLYAATLFVALPLGFLSAAFIGRKNQGRFFGKNLRPSLVLAHGLFWAWVWCRPATELLSYDLLINVLWTLPLLSVLTAWTAAYPGRSWRGVWTRSQDITFILLPILILALLWHFMAGLSPDLGTLALWASVAGFLLALLFLDRGRDRPPLDRLDAALCALLVLATLAVNPGSEANYDKNYYLGPVNEVLSGRSMLVDVHCLYGVGLIYFLAGLFKVLGMKAHYTPFGFLLMAFAAGLHLLQYWMARLLFRSRLLALLCAAAILCLQGYGSFAGFNNIVYPSVGPLRFGLPMLLLAAGFLRRSRGSRAWAWAELGLLGLASVWSLETFVYCLSAWSFSECAEAWAGSSAVLEVFSRLWTRVLKAAGAIALAHAGLALFTLLRSGSLPHWGVYFYYMVYASGDVLSYPLALWTPWILLPGLLGLSLLALALLTRERKGLDPGHYCMVGAAGAAAAEFSYFIMRAHPNNLGHIAPLFLILFFYWMDKAWKGPSSLAALRWTATAAALLVLAALLWNAWDSIRLRSSQSALAWMAQDAGSLFQGKPLPLPEPYDRLWNPRAVASPSVQACLDLMARHAPAQERIAVFTPFMGEVYALSGRANPYPIGYYLQDDGYQGYVARLAAGPVPMKAGDLMLLAQDKDGGFTGMPDLPELYRGYRNLFVLLDAVRKNFRLVPLELYPSEGIWALRLYPLDPAPLVPSGALRGPGARFKTPA